MGKRPDAVRAFEAAIAAAARGGDATVAARAQIELLTLLSFEGRSPDEAQRWAGYVEAQIDRLRRPHPARRAPRRPRRGC